MREYFDGWRNKPLDQIFRLARDLVEDPDYPTVKAWRAEGGRVLGHFQVYFPEELAHAAGWLPVKMRGAQAADTESESLFGSYLCSIIKTSLALCVSKSLELDLFVTLPICDAARNLGPIWGRNFDYKCQILYLPQNANSRYAPTYLAKEYRRMLRDIEDAAGRKIGDDDVRRSIAVYNRSRALMRELYAIRREQPWLVSVDESMALIGLAGFLPRQEFNEIMTAVLPMIRARPNQPRSRIRVVLEGGFCEIPPFDLLQMVSRSCYVVDDDLYIGLRYLEEEVAVTGDPVANLADAYLEHSTYSPVQHDHRKPKEDMLLERIRKSSAEAAILIAAKMCEPGLEEQVGYTKGLDRAQIPYFISEFEENQTSFDNLEIQLETFVENIMFD